MIRRLLPLAAFLALAALLFAGIRMNAGKDTSAIDSPLIGKSAPGLSLPVLGQPGRNFGNQELAGQPYLLNVWGSWCVNCRVEHPLLQALALRNGIRIVGYNYKDEPADAQRWLAELGNPYHVVVADYEGRVALDWGIYGAPETFLVDGRGFVRWKHVGPLDETIIGGQLVPMIAALRVSR